MLIKNILKNLKTLKKVVFCKRKGGGPAAVVKAACLESRRLRVQTPLWPPSFKETKCSVQMRYCGEPPLPGGSVLGLRLPGPEFRIVCLEGSVISLSSGSSPGPVLPLCAQITFISFHFLQTRFTTGSERKLFRFRGIEINDLQIFLIYKNFYISLTCWYLMC